MADYFDAYEPWFVFVADREVCVSNTSSNGDGYGCTLARRINI